MIKSSTRSWLAVRGLSVLRSVGAWVVISPEQTYVATSIRGLGPCRSTYCRAERRELPVSVGADVGSKWVPLVAAALAAVGLLASCATYRPMVDRHGMANLDQYERDLVDCQNSAGPVSPGGPVHAGGAFRKTGCAGTAVGGTDFDTGKGRGAGAAAMADRPAAGTRDGNGERIYLALN